MNNFFYRDTKFFIYVCPRCGNGSWQMDIMDSVYTPTEKNLTEHPDLIHLAGEVLRCPNCKLIMTWFDMQKLGKTGEGYE